MNYTKEHIEEIKKCMDPISGPEYFLRNFFMVQHPVLGKITMSMHQYQLDYLHNIHSHQQSINQLARQLCKTSILAGYALWMVTFAPPACTILLCATKFVGAKDMMQKVRFGYDNLPEYMKVGVVSHRAVDAEFDNGSRIIARVTSENAVRGMAITMVMLDDFAFVDHSVATGLFACIMPMLATGGKIAITSSFNTDGTVFDMLWDDAVAKRNNFSPFEATWDADPDRSSSWATSQRNFLGDSSFCREHLNCTLELAEA